MKKFTFSLKSSLYSIVGVLFLSFTAYEPAEEDAVYVQQKLTSHYNAEATVKNIKKYELSVTEKGFCRYKRYFNNGKVEYFSFNLVKYKNLDYLGTAAAGTLMLRTNGDDVIVQTHHDRRGGDIDSMATYMAIPLKNLEAEDLIDLSERLSQISRKLQ